jgi:hypothetical protein
MNKYREVLFSEDDKYTNRYSLNQQQNEIARSAKADE